jgi:hypothetical protein
MLYVTPMMWMQIVENILLQINIFMELCTSTELFKASSLCLKSRSNYTVLYFHPTSSLFSVIAKSSRHFSFYFILNDLYLSIFSVQRNGFTINSLWITCIFIQERLKIVLWQQQCNFIM